MTLKREFLSFLAGYDGSFNPLSDWLEERGYDALARLFRHERLSRGSWSATIDDVDAFRMDQSRAPSHTHLFLYLRDGDMIRMIDAINYDLSHATTYRIETEITELMQ